jgi:hypothetical protein
MQIVCHLIVQFGADISLFVLRKSIADVTRDCTFVDVASVGDWLDNTTKVTGIGFTTNVNILVSTIKVSIPFVGINVSRLVTTEVSRIVSTTNVSRPFVGTNVSRFVTINADLLTLMPVDLSI